MLGGILVFSLVISIVSGVYYFKFYELMSPPTSDAQAKSVVMTKQVAYMVHDRASFALTVVLSLVMAI